MGIFYLLHKKYPPQTKTAATEAGGGDDNANLGEKMVADPAGPVSNPLDGADEDLSPDGMLTPGRF